MKNKKKTFVGAIRWDAWVSDNHPVGLEVEKTLSNSKYLSRRPFYTEIDDNKFKIQCTTEEIIKKEIEYASNYGIDYFAFCWYPHNSGLDIARKLYLNIKQNDVKWCLILGTNPFKFNDADWLVNEFSKENYLKINGRPVIYLFNINEELLDIVNYIREKCFKVKPYFVGLVWNYEQAKLANNQFSLDAISQYCTPGQNNLAYEHLSKIEREKWSEYLRINKVVPWVTTGWDKRPRFDNPVSWEDCKDFDIEYIKYPTKDELRYQMEKSLDFANTNESELILIYAWNEFDEGGFICPTLEDGKINISKLETIKESIDKNLNM